MSCKHSYGSLLATLVGLAAESVIPSFLTTDPFYGVMRDPQREATLTECLSGCRVRMFLENKPDGKPKPKGIDVNFERLVMLVCMSGLRGDDDVPGVLLSIARNWGFSQLGTILGTLKL